MLSKTHSLTIGTALLALAGTAHADSSRVLNTANYHAYQRFDSQVDWDTAKAGCEGLGGYLATITSQTEQDWVADNVADGQTVLLGGFIDNPGDTWGKWVTDETWNYTNWSSGSPSGGSEDALEMLSDGTWNDLLSTSEPRSWACEWSPLYLDIAVVFRASRPLPGTNINPGFAISDYALLASYGDAYCLYLLNGYTGSISKSTALGTTAIEGTPKSITVTDHMGRALVTVLTNKADGSSTSRVYDATTGALLRTIDLPGSVATPL